MNINMENVQQDFLELELEDDQWPFKGVDHERQIVRAIVFDAQGNLYFVRAVRDDEFGKAVLIETSGGGVESDENLEEALRRELKEELGAQVEIIKPIGVVKDFYNLIGRKNINHYYLCKALSFGKKNLMPDEISNFHLSTLVLTGDQALTEYEQRMNTPLGKLIGQREIPVLKKALKMIEKMSASEL